MVLIFVCLVFVTRQSSSRKMDEIMKEWLKVKTDVEESEWGLDVRRVNGVKKNQWKKSEWRLMKEELTESSRHEKRMNDEKRMTCN